MMNSKINRPSTIDLNNIIVRTNSDYFEKLENLNGFQNSLLSLSQRFSVFNMNEANTKFSKKAIKARIRNDERT